MGVLQAQTTTSMDKIDFKEETKDIKWSVVNDSVMGGRSEGSIVSAEDNIRLFKGVISLKNNGGFSSVRTIGGKYELSKHTGMEIKVRGDGRTYYFTLRSANNDQIAFWHSVETTAGEWTTLKLPFSAFYATFYGKKFEGQVLGTSNISSVGFMLYDKKSGVFKLEIQSIKVY